MRGMTTQETTNPSISIPLETLSSEGKPLPTTPDEESVSLTSPSLLRATEISLQKVENPLLRVKLRDVISNNIARRALKTSIVLGILTVVYWGISLVPAFQAAGAAVENVGLQTKSAAGSSQSLTFSFLQECTSRMIQKLPLGDDCLKHMRKTPKAPPDIDIWVVNPATSNSSAGINNASSTALLSREALRTVMMHRSIIEQNGTWPGDFIQSERWHLDANIMKYVNICGIFLSLTALCFAYSGTFRRMAIKFVGRVERACLFIATHVVAYPLSFVGIVLGMMLGSIIYTAVSKYNTQVASWSAAAEFFETCRQQKEIENFASGDCEKYQDKQVKPKPELSGFAISLSSIIIAWSFFTAGVMFLLKRLKAEIYSPDEASVWNKRDRERDSEQASTDTGSHGYSMRNLDSLSRAIIELPPIEPVGSEMQGPGRERSSDAPLLRQLVSLPKDTISAVESLPHTIERSHG